MVPATPFRSKMLLEALFWGRTNSQVSGQEDCLRIQPEIENQRGKTRQGVKAMSVFKRGNTWWYEFHFNLSRIRESAKTSSKTVARDAERARRHQLELGVNGISKRSRPPLFSLAADRWLESKTALTPLGKAYYQQYIRKLKRQFGGRLISDIDADDIALLQKKRKGEKLSGRQINCEIATLRAILRRHGLWAGIAHDVTMMPERTDTGRALSSEDEAKLLDAIAQSTSPALYPFFILSVDAGLRPSETRSLLRRNLNLVRRDGAVVEGEILVGRSKTDAGAGRIVPLTRRARAALTLWLDRFPDAGPHSYLFPFHHVGFAGNDRKPHLWGIDLGRSMGTHSYKRAWETAREKAGLTCRLYDARHTFITRLAENPAVSEETIRQLSGHVSPRMLSRYAHVRMQARRGAIATLEQQRPELSEFDSDSPQKSPQLGKGEVRVLN
jgi:integrase